MDKLSSYVIFCDDVRQEVGDKKTYVGVYNEELYVPDLPTLIPKFYVITNITCYKEKIPKTLAVRLTLGDEELDKTNVGSDELEKWRTESQEGRSKSAEEFSPDRSPKTRITLEMFISPFVIHKEGRLASYVDTELGTMRAGSIKITRREGAPTVALELRSAKTERRPTTEKAP